MNHLVVACIDDQVSLRAAAAALPVDQREPLRYVARRRSAFGRELATCISELGGTPARHGSVRPRLRALAQRANRALVGGTLGDAYRGLAAAEARTESLYTEVLRHDLPPDARATVERQHDEIARDQSAFRRQQWSGPAHAMVAPEPPEAPAEPARTTTPRAHGPGHLARWADDGGRQPDDD
jgi:uncharacterized protein (TIGR02284 family)